MTDWISIARARRKADQSNARAWRAQDSEAQVLEWIARGLVTARGRQCQVSLTKKWFVDGAMRHSLEVIAQWGDASHVKDIPADFWKGHFFWEDDESAALLPKYEGFVRDWNQCRFAVGNIGYSDVEVVSRKKPNSGAKPKYDWPLFLATVIDHLDHEGGFHEGFRKADAERLMARWCTSQWGAEPSEASLKRYVTRAGAEYLKGKQMKAQN